MDQVMNNWLMHNMLMSIIIVDFSMRLFFKTI